MSSLKQYIELYLSHRDTINAGSAQVMNRLRPQALATLEHARLPRRGDEGHEAVDVESVMAPDYGVNISRMDLRVDPSLSFHCHVPNLSTLMGIVANDTFHPSATLSANLPEGVTFGSLRKAAESDPELVGGVYGQIAPLTDPCVALNTLLAQDGVWIRIAPGVRLEKPLQLVNIFSALTDIMAVRRIVIDVEEGASARILVCDHTQDNERRYLSSQVVEINLAQGASLEYCDLEESTALTSRISQIYVRQHEGSELRINSSALSGGTTRNELHVDLSGQNASAMLSGMAIASGTRIIDNATDVVHSAPRCHSDQLFKYVLDGNSRGGFEGSIKVCPGACLTEAYQSNRNIVAANTAKMHSQPALEIYNDDVKCSHGASTGQLDPEALFYMRSRGIPEAEAKVMLMQAFMVDVIDTVRIDGLRDRLRHLVDMRFSGHEVTCRSCDAAAGVNNIQ